jgi:hypothetical protein
MKNLKGSGVRDQRLAVRVFLSTGSSVQGHAPPEIDDYFEVSI